MMRYAVHALAAVVLAASCTYTPECENTPARALTDPTGLALSPDGATLYITNANAALKYCSSYISRVNLTSTTLSAETVYPLGGSPAPSFVGGVVVSPSGKRMFVADRGNNAVMVIHTASTPFTLETTVHVGTAPYALAYISETARVLAANMVSNDVSVIDAETFSVVAVIPLTGGEQNLAKPAGIAVNPLPGRAEAYVTQQLSSNISILDLSLLCEYNRSLPPAVDGPYFNDTGAASSPSMSAISLRPCAVQTEEWTATFTTGTGGQGAYQVGGRVSGLQLNSAQEGEVYTSGTGGISFSVAPGALPTTVGDTFTFATTRRGGVMTTFGNISDGAYRGISISADGRRAAVISRGLRSLEIADLDTHTIIDSIQVCSVPEDVAFHPLGRKVYVTCASPSALFEVDIFLRQVTGVVPMDGRPAAIVLSPDGAKAYIANYQGQTVEIIDLSTLTLAGRIR